MKLKFGQAITPLLVKEKLFISSEYYDAYDDLTFSAEFKFQHNGDTYMYFCATYDMEEILQSLENLALQNPCSMLTHYLENFGNFDEAFEDWWQISDKELFAENLKRISQTDVSEKTKAVALQLIDLMADSGNNNLFVCYG